MKNQRLEICIRTTACLSAMLVAVASIQAQDDVKGVGARPTVLFGPLAEKAPTGNAGMFVGVNQFTRDDGLNELAYAVHDAIELAHLFVFELKLMPASNCYLLLSGEPAPNAGAVKQHLSRLKAAGAKVSAADRSKILLTFLDLRKLATNESNLFVCSFSSHGFNEGRTAYVMPSDGHRELLSDTAVPLETIESKMEDSKAGHRLLLVDACQERVSARGSTSAGNAANAAFIDALKTPSGQAKLASCSPGEFSYEHRSLGSVGHGVFTYSFLEALRGGAKPDKENLVRLGSVSEYVAANVSAWTKELGRSSQTPFLESPIDARKLPLATKADDVTSLVASVQRAPLTGELTREMRDRLVKALQKANPSDSSDRQFVSSTRDFVQGRFNAGVYIPYAKGELDRLLLAPPELLVSPFSSNAARAAQEAWSKYLDQEIDVKNSIGMKLKLIPAGEFMMGSGASIDELTRIFASSTTNLNANIESVRSEFPQHRVRISKPFRITVTEITQGQWQNVMGTKPWTKRLNPQVTIGPDYAATWIGWDDAKEFCRRLSVTEGRNYRLPTEAEWEYACRAGSQFLYYFGDDLAKIDDYGWQNQNFGLGKERFAHLTKQLLPNAWGLYDMHGNAFEWCSDWYDSGYYSRSPTVDPLGPSKGTERVARGGSWHNYPFWCRSACRASLSSRSQFTGFRIVCMQLD